jgi:hypothetical protein
MLQNNYNNALDANLYFYAIDTNFKYQFYFHFYSKNNNNFTKCWDKRLHKFNYSLFVFLTKFCIF